MSINRRVIVFRLVLPLACLLASQVLQAEPILSVSNLGANDDGNLEWLVEITPDPNLVGDGSSLGAELGFEFSGSKLLSTSVNEVWKFENPGFNPFTETVTVGAVTSETEAFVSLGTDPLEDKVELLTFTTEGSGDTLISWGNYEIRPGLVGGFSGGLIAQAGEKFDGFRGSLEHGGLSSGADCNQDGVVDADDLLCACGTGVLGDVLGELNLLAGDLNGDNAVDFTDFLVLSTNFGESSLEYSDGDINCDGEVGFADFLVLSENFGQTTGVAAVPEPSFGPNYFLGFVLFSLGSFRIRGDFAR